MPSEDLAERLRVLLDDTTAHHVTDEALGVLPEMFGHTGAHGVMMAVRAAGVSEDPTVVTESFIALVSELQHTLERSHRQSRIRGADRGAR